MSDKKVVWPEAQINKAPRREGTYGSFKEFLAKANDRQAEQQQAIDYLQKAHKPMVTLLEMRLKKGEPLFVRRPLNYRTSKFNESSQTFVDVVETVYPGTKLILKSLDPNLREFIFQDAMGNEVAIPYDEKNKLMTQTDIFETVQKYFETVGE